MKLRMAFYDEADVPRLLVGGDEAGIAAAKADLPMTAPPWTWRLMASSSGPGGERFNVDPEVMILAAVGPLASYPQPDDAPR